MDAILEFGRIEASTQGVACEVSVVVDGTEVLQRTVYVTSEQAAALSKDSTAVAAQLAALFEPTIQADLDWHAQQKAALAAATGALPVVEAVVKGKSLDMATGMLTGGSSQQM